MPPPPRSTLFPYTTLFRSDPRDVVRELNGYFTEMNEAIRRHRGLVLQFIGDEIEAVFGAPVNCRDRKSTRLNSSHRCISYAVFCLKKKKKITTTSQRISKD